MNTQATTTTAPKANRAARRAAQAKASKAPAAKAVTNAATKAPARDHRDYYRQAYLTNWPREAGPAPTMALLDAVHAIDPGKRPGHEALNVAMCLRPQGASVREFLLASNAKGPAHNYRRALIGVDRVVTDAPLPGDGRAYRFKVTLTAKGAAMVKAAGVVLPKGVDAPKAKAPRKPRAAKAKPATVTTTAPVDGGSGDQPATPQS